MPILVVGADHPLGRMIVRALAAPDREVRAFISDPTKGAELRAWGVKVAVGDLSDEGHIEAAATNCFSVAFVAPALHDGRELAFAPVERVPSSWARASSRVRRVIWVGESPPEFGSVERAIVSPDQSPERVAEEVLRYDDVERLDT